MFRHSTMASIAFTIVLTGCLPPTEVVPLGNGPLGAGQGGQTGGQPGIGGPGAGEMGGGTPAGTAGTQQSGGASPTGSAGTQQSGAASPTGSAGTQQSGAASPTGSAGTVQMAGTTQVGAGGGGGDGSTLPVCSSVAEPPRNVGCVQPKGGWPTTTDIVGEATARFEGTITAIGKATATSGCLNSCGGYPPIDDSSRTVALTVAATTDAGAQEWNIEYEARAPRSSGPWARSSRSTILDNSEIGLRHRPSSPSAPREAWSSRSRRQPKRPPSRARPQSFGRAAPFAIKSTSAGLGSAIRWKHAIQ